jgi:hypothetical protein
MFSGRFSAGQREPCGNCPEMGRSPPSRPGEVPGCPVDGSRRSAARARLWTSSRASGNAMISSIQRRSRAERNTHMPSAPSFRPAKGWPCPRLSICPFAGDSVSVVGRKAPGRVVALFRGGRYPQRGAELTTPMRLIAPGLPAALPNLHQRHVLSRRGQILPHHLLGRHGQLWRRVPRRPAQLPQRLILRRQGQLLQRHLLRRPG